MPETFNPPTDTAWVPAVRAYQPDQFVDASEGGSDNWPIEDLAKRDAHLLGRVVAAESAATTDAAALVTETAARIAADNAEVTARAAAVTAEATARAAADAALDGRVTANEGAITALQQLGRGGIRHAILAGALLAATGAPWHLGSQMVGRSIASLATAISGGDAGGSPASAAIQGSPYAQGPADGTAGAANVWASSQTGAGASGVAWHGLDFGSTPRHLRRVVLRNSTTTSRGCATVIVERADTPGGTWTAVQTFSAQPTAAGTVAVLDLPASAAYRCWRWRAGEAPANGGSWVIGEVEVSEEQAATTASQVGLKAGFAATFGAGRDASGLPVDQTLVLASGAAAAWTALGNSTTRYLYVERTGPTAATYGHVATVPVVRPTAPPTTYTVPGTLHAPATAIANGGTAANAFDAALGTYWGSPLGGAANDLTAYLGQDWGVGQTRQVAKVVIKNPDTSGFGGTPTGYAAESVRVQYSLTDGTTWVDHETFSGLATASLGVSTLTLATPTPAARYHRILCVSGIDTGQAWSVAELEFYAPDTNPASTDLHWFDTTTGQMRHFNGAAWVNVARIFVGWATTDSAGNVTAVLPAAIQQARLPQAYAELASAASTTSTTVVAVGTPVAIHTSGGRLALAASGIASNSSSGSGVTPCLLLNGVEVATATFGAPGSSVWANWALHHEAALPPGRHTVQLGLRAGANTASMHAGRVAARELT